MQQPRAPLPIAIWLVMLPVAALVTTVLMGAFAALYWLKASEAQATANELTSAKASARKAWQKVYDMQEAEDKAESDEMGRLRVQLWEATTALDTCKKGKQ